MGFADLGLGEEVLRAVAEAGYTQPTPIQEQAIPLVLTGRDVLGCAQTGTGKTAGFTLPMIEILASGRARARMPRSLILEPTRELAAQVADNFATYGKYHKLTMALLIGGMSLDEQFKRLDRGVDVLIATPGRLLDLFERGRILLSDIKILVIDEADRMLDMGFIPDIEQIVRLLPPMRQTLMFCATMPPEIRRLADQFLMGAKEVWATPPASLATTVTHNLVVVSEADKPDVLRRLMRTENVANALIFCNRKRDVDTLYRALKKDGFDISALHGDMDQPMRMETLERFKAGTCKLMVASDVAARGLDIDRVSHVFNYDVPQTAEDYVHRIGRTGRAGRAGIAYTLATPRDGAYLAAIEQLIGMAIPRVAVEGFATAEVGSADRKRRSRGAKQPEKHGREATHEAPRKSARQTTPAAPPKLEPAKPETAKPAPAKAARPARRKQRAEKPEPEAAVIGMGDHVPQFLLRPVRIPERS